MRVRLAVVLPLLLVASGAIWWVAPQGAAQTSVSCGRHLPVADSPLEMNTVVSDPRTSQFRDPLFKHVIMEKYSFECEELGGPNDRTFILDVELFIEIIQRAQGGRTTSVEKRVEEIVCEKGQSPSPFVVQCSARDIPLTEGAPTGVVCSANPQNQPKDPVEMNTAITSRQDTVKTMKVEKELFVCGSSEGHFFLFTEIVEGRAGGAADTIRPTEKKFQAILCLMGFPTLGFESCHHFIPGPTNG